MRSGFFDNVEVVSEDFARFAAGILKNGILLDGPTLEVSPSSGMKISVNTGYCWIGGHYGVCETPEILTLDIADGEYARIDRVVARMDFNEGAVFLTVLKGTISDSPAPPDIVRNADIYDLCLAEITVPAGSVEVETLNIKDTRFDEDLCGVVTSIAEGIKSQELYKMYQRRWELLMATAHIDEPAVIAAFENFIKAAQPKIMPQSISELFKII